MLQVQYVKRYVVVIGEDGNNDASEIKALASLCLVPYEAELTVDRSSKLLLIGSMLERELIYTEQMYRQAHQIFSEVSALIYRKRREAEKLNSCATRDMLIAEINDQYSSLVKLKKIFRAYETSDEEVA